MIIIYYPSCNPTCVMKTGMISDKLKVCGVQPAGMHDFTKMMSKGSISCHHHVMILDSGLSIIS